MGVAANELGRDIQAAYREKRGVRRAMLGSETMNLADLMPTRGKMVSVLSSFNPGAMDVLPTVDNILRAGERFKITRRFATVSDAKEPESGDLTVSSEAINSESYDVLNVDGVEVYFQNYTFGNAFLTPDDMTKKVE
jgi:hypothetical protein